MKPTKIFSETNIATQAQNALPMSRLNWLRSTGAAVLPALLNCCIEDNRIQAGKMELWETSWKGDYICLTTRKLVQQELYDKHPDVVGSFLTTSSSRLHTRANIL